MFVQIAKGRHKKKKEIQNEYDEDNGSMRSGEGRNDEAESGSFTEVNLDMTNESDKIEEGKNVKEEPMVGTSKQVNKEGTFLNKISEKANKLKRESLSRIFGEKENDVKIYTIDQEMKKNEPSSHVGVTRKTDFPKFLSTEFAEPKTHKFHNTKLNEKLEKSRKLTTVTNQTYKSTGVQASPFPNYRLYFLPCSSWNDPEEKVMSILRVLLCQLSLASFLFVWIIFAALMFYLTEGFTEYEEREIYLGDEENILYSLATDMRMIPSNSTVWKPTFEKYLIKHRTLLTEYLKKGYNEDGEIWTYSGSFLICLSIVNVFGYGFPMPKTVGGNIILVFFTIIGLPLNLILLRSAGLSLAAKMQLIAKDIELHLHTLGKRIRNVRKYGDSKPRVEEDWPKGVWEDEFRPPWWLPCIVPFMLFLWYAIGCLLLGLARLGSSANVCAVLFFSRDLVTNFQILAPFTRLSFALYLQLSSLLVSLSIALISVPSPTSVIDSFIQNLFLTNSLS